MRLNRQKELADILLRPFLEEIYEKCATRSGLKNLPRLEDLKATAYIDNTLIFVILASKDKNYTGWAKFNSSDEAFLYNEEVGTRKAVHRAICKIIGYEQRNNL